MPLGPTMSTPASAWASAISAYAASVASLSTSPSGVEHAAVAVVGELVEAQVAHHGERVADLGDDVADRQVEDAVRVDRAGAGGVLGGRDAEEHHARRARARPPRRRPSAASRGCAGRRRASRRSAAARRCPRGRTSAAPAAAARREVSATSRRIAGGAPQASGPDDRPDDASWAASARAARSLARCALRRAAGLALARAGDGLTGLEHREAAGRAEVGERVDQQLDVGLGRHARRPAGRAPRRSWPWPGR